MMVLAEIDQSPWTPLGQTDYTCVLIHLKLIKLMIKLILFKIY